MSSLQTDIEARLAETAPDVEVLLAEVLGGHTVRLFIDHPDGVSVALRRFLGRRARVRLRDVHDGHSSFTGELVGATEAEVTIAMNTTPPTLIAIPYADIRKSNLVEE